MNDNILVTIKRNNIDEKIYLGEAIALDCCSNKIFECNYDKAKNIIFRSMQKPFQAYCFLQSGAYEKFGLNEKHLAVISGSHAGTPAQVKIVQEILQRAKLKVSDLNCPKDYPLDIKSKYDLIRQNKGKSVLYDNCSGKHAGMLAACKSYNFDIKSYQYSEHPLQRKIVDTTLKLCEFEKEILAKDGCGVPVLAMPLEFMARGLLNLSNTNEGRKIINAVIKYPMLFGGNNRFDSEIIKLKKGKFFAKVGAAGLVGVLNIEEGSVLVVKIFADDHDARKQVTLDFMKKLNWI